MLVVGFGVVENETLDNAPAAESSKQLGFAALCLPQEVRTELVATAGSGERLEFGRKKRVDRRQPKAMKKALDSGKATEKQPTGSTAEEYLLITCQATQKGSEDSLCRRL